MVSRQTVTLANSIVGVSVLAMPFCFKQCGIVLATVMLMLGAVITRMVCYFLLKAATITRRRTYEMLAWHTFGSGGKFIVEISIIGFLIGTLIAFFVVMGDLGPEIISELFPVENNSSLRNIIMTALCLFVALPLGLLRNIESLSSVSTASVLFYVFLVFKILSEGVGPLFSGSYLDKIDYWRPAGVLQCIPIFSMALSCQTQIFGIYESLPDPSLQKMNQVVKEAVTICTVFYFCIGFFGYIAFSHQTFGGNILMTLSPSWTTQLIKTCFLMSIVFSVPLVVFPCRASLHSLIFRRVQMHHSLHDVSTNYIPETRLKALTISIIAFTLFVGILIPNIELVLGLVGSTTGTVICVIFPSIMFIRVTSKDTTERLVAQVLFFTGVVMMVVSTYATLYAVEQAQINEPQQAPPSRVTEIIKNIQQGESKENIVDPSPPPSNGQNKADFQPDFKFQPKKVELVKSFSEKPSRGNEGAGEKPQKMANEVKEKEKGEVKAKNLEEAHPLDRKEQVGSVKSEKEMKEQVINDDKKDPSELKSKVGAVDDDSLVVQKGNVEEGGEEKPGHLPSIKDEEKVESVGGVDKKDPPQPPPAPLNKKDEVVEGKGDVAAALLKKLEEHEENQKKFLEEQRLVLAELKEHHAQDVQRQKEDPQEAQPPQSDNNLPGKVKGEEANKQEKLEEKLHVIQQGQIIQKLSENIAKEVQNVKLIEKLEEGLDLEIKKKQVVDDGAGENVRKEQEGRNVQEPKPQEQPQQLLSSPSISGNNNINFENVPLKKLSNVSILNDGGKVGERGASSFLSQQSGQGGGVGKELDVSSSPPLIKLVKKEVVPPPPPLLVLNSGGRGSDPPLQGGLSDKKKVDRDI